MEPEAPVPDHEDGGGSMSTITAAVRTTGVNVPVWVWMALGLALGLLYTVTLDNGWIVVLVPQAPTTMSGNVMYVPPDSVRILDITMTQATNLVRSIGIGSRQILRGAEMAPAG